MVEQEKRTSISTNSKEQNQGMPPYIVKFPENKSDLTASNQSEKEKKRMAIIDYVKTWQEEHPGRRGAQSAAGKMFGISRAGVRKILAKYHDELLKPTGVISLTKLAHQIGAKPRDILNSLHRGEISFGNEKIDKFYTQTKRLNLIRGIRRIPIALIDKDKIKNQLENVEKVMKRLSLGIAVRNKISFPPLSQLSKLANITYPREINKIYQELSDAGFHLKKLPKAKNKNSPFYYFAHHQEAPAIILYLQKISGKTQKLKFSAGEEDQNQDWWSNLV